MHSFSSLKSRSLREYYSSPMDPAVRTDLDVLVARLSDLAELFGNGTLSVEERDHAIETMEMVWDVMASLDTLAHQVAMDRGPAARRLSRMIQDRLDAAHADFEELDTLLTQGHADEHMCDVACRRVKKILVDSQTRSWLRAVEDIAESLACGKKQLSLSTLRSQLFGRERKVYKHAVSEADQLLSELAPWGEKARSNIGHLHAVAMQAWPDCMDENEERPQGATDENAIREAIASRSDLASRYLHLKSFLLHEDEVTERTIYAPAPEPVDLATTPDEAFAMVMSGISDQIPELAPILADVKSAELCRIYIYGCDESPYMQSDFGLRPPLCLNIPDGPQAMFDIARGVMQASAFVAAWHLGPLRRRADMLYRQVCSNYGCGCLGTFLAKHANSRQERLAVACLILEQMFRSLFLTVVHCRFQSDTPERLSSYTGCHALPADTAWITAHKDILGPELTLSNAFGRWWMLFPYVLEINLPCPDILPGIAAGWALYVRHGEQPAHTGHAFRQTLERGCTRSGKDLLAEIGMTTDASDWIKAALLAFERELSWAEKLAIR